MRNLWHIGVDFLQTLWHSFLALHPWGYVIAAALALLALLKGKAIGAATSAAWKVCDTWFWEKVRKKVSPQERRPQTGYPQPKTYTGIFRGYYQYENSPRDWFFELYASGFTWKVPVHPTQLFSGVQHGKFVEVDTEVIAGSTVEIVKRVRIDETP